VSARHTGLGERRHPPPPLVATGRYSATAVVAVAAAAAVAAVAAVIVDRAKRAKELVFLPFRATPSRVVSCRAVPCSIVSRSNCDRQRFFNRATSWDTRQAKENERERERKREESSFCDCREGEKRERTREQYTWRSSNAIK